MESPTNLAASRTCIFSRRSPSRSRFAFSVDRVFAAPISCTSASTVTLPCKYKPLPAPVPSSRFSSKMVINAFGSRKMFLLCWLASRRPKERFCCSVKKHGCAVWLHIVVLSCCYRCDIHIPRFIQKTSIIHIICHFFFFFMICALKKKKKKK
jgi:hypothetical protein